MASRTHILLGLLALFLFAGPAARAEQRPDASLYPWLIQMGPIIFNRGGGAFLPNSVLNGLKQGQVSPILQFTMVNNLMAKCTQDVMQYTPDIRDPFLVANAKFQYGLCRIKKCFQQGMLVLLLPALSGGDSQDQQGASQQGLMLAQAFQKDPACDGQGGSGLDPGILAAFAGH